MIFGSSNGVTVFYPERISENRLRSADQAD